MRRTLATLTVLLCTTAFASGCGGQDESPSTTEPTSTEANSDEATPTDPASSEASEPTETVQVLPRGSSAPSRNARASSSR